MSAMCRKPLCSRVWASLGRLRPLAGSIPGFVLAGALSLAALLALLATTELKTRGTAAFSDPGWDRHLYIEMAANNPLDFHLAPFCWRVLVPALVSVLPGDLQAAFFLITAVSLWASGALLFLLLRWQAGSAIAASGTLIFFSLGWGAKFALADFWIPDAAVLAFATACLLMAPGKHNLLLAGCLAAGAASKESALFAVPLIYTLRATRPLDGPAARRALLVAAPALAIAAAIRLWIPAFNADSAYVATLPSHISRFPEIFPDYNYVSLARDIGYEQRVLDFEPGDFWSYTTRPFGIALPLLALVGAWRRPLLALRLLPFNVLVYAQLFFATDTERLLVLAAPVLLWIAAAGAVSFGPRSAVAGAALVLGLGLFGARLVSSGSYGLAPALQVGSIASAAVAYLAVAHFRRRAGYV